MVKVLFDKMLLQASQHFVLLTKNSTSGSSSSYVKHSKRAVKSRQYSHCYRWMDECVDRIE